MSWQATAWGTKRITGSPARKLLLLVLANYADDLGYCWPSQKTLADDTELSTDTIQRQLKQLAKDGHIKIEKRPRASGRWPAQAYRLNMAEPSITEPHRAVRCDGDAHVTHADALKPDPCSLRPGRAAPCGITGPQALRHEPSIEPSGEPSPPSSTSCSVPREARRTAEEGRRERTEVVQARVAARLGHGDVAAGWLILGMLNASSQTFLTSCERNSALTDAIVDQHRQHAHSAMRDTQGRGR